MKNTLAFLLVASAVSGAFAQSPAASVGALQNVQGLVTVSQANTIGNAVSGSSISNGASVAATSTGSAVIILNNGCRFSLSPNQSVVINTAVPCATLIASVRPATGVAVASVPADRDAYLAGYAALGVLVLLDATRGTSALSGS